MQSENPLFADLAKMLKETLGGMDFVSREEFDAVKDMAAKAREETEALKARIAALEAGLAGASGGKGKKSAGT